MRQRGYACPKTPANESASATMASVQLTTKTTSTGLPRKPWRASTGVSTILMSRCSIYASTFKQNERTLYWVPSWRHRVWQQSGNGTAKREIMIPFELAQELKSAGFTRSTALDAVYALGEHLRVRRHDALQMWYGSKRKTGLALELEQQAIYTPTLSIS
jgi:hypothetical protein